VLMNTCSGRRGSNWCPNWSFCDVSDEEPMMLYLKGLLLRLSRSVRDCGN
jgi:hypothetical protein